MSDSLSSNQRCDQHGSERCCITAECEVQWQRAEIERLTAEKAEYHGKAAALLIERDRLVRELHHTGIAEARLRAALDEAIKLLRNSIGANRMYDSARHLFLSNHALSTATVDSTERGADETTAVPCAHLWRCWSSENGTFTERCDRCHAERYRRAGELNYVGPL